MSILHDPGAKAPEAHPSEPLRPEKSGAPVVHIGPDGKATVWNGAIQNKRIGSMLRKLHVAAKPRIVLLSAVIGLSLLIVLLTGSRAEPFIGKILGKDSACCRKIATLADCTEPGNSSQTSLYINAEGTVSLALPDRVWSGAAADQEEASMLFVSEDGTLSILLETTDRQEMPIQLRTLHRLTLESMTSELNAQAASPSCFLFTRGGNEAFETCMRDETYDYGIITAASADRFVSLLIAALRSGDQEDTALQQQLAGLIRAAGSSLYIE